MSWLPSWLPAADNEEEFMEKEKEKILTFDEVMDLLHVKKTTMYKIMSSPSKIPFVEIGSKKSISEASFYEWFHKNEGNRII